MAAKRGDLHGLLDNVLLAHRNDIETFTSGHLNEANLYNPNKITKSKQTWKTSGRRPTMLQRSELPGRQVVVTPAIQDTIIDFSLGTARAPLKRMKVASSLGTLHDSEENEDSSLYGKVEDGNLVEEIKLSDTMLTRSENYLTRGWAKEDFKHQGKLKPLSHGMKKDENLLGIMKHHFIPNHLENVTKKDQFHKMKDFENRILRKHDATEQNVLTGMKAVHHLEAKLKQDLDNLPYDGYGPNFHRLQLYSNTFDGLISDSITFGFILKTIKKEYDAYVSSLLDAQRDKHRLLYNQVEKLYSNGASNTQVLNKAIKNVHSLQDEAQEKLRENERLRKQIQHEKHLDTLPIETPVQVRMSSFPIGNEIEISEQIEQLHTSIIEKMSAIKELKDRLRKEYVPSTVTQHLEQCIKETEVEIQKLTSTKEYFDSSINELQKELHEAIAGADTTEKDAKRVWRKVSAVKLLSLNTLNGEGKKYELEESDSEDDHSKWDWYIS